MTTKKEREQDKEIARAFATQIVSAINKQDEETKNLIKDIDDLKNINSIRKQKI